MKVTDGKIIAVMEDHRCRYPRVDVRERRKAEWTIWQCPCGLMYRFQFDYTYVDTRWWWAPFKGPK